MLRRIGAFFAGVIVAFVIVQIAEFGVHAMNPFPPGTNTKDFAEIKKYVAALPVSAMVLVLSGWLVGTFAGTFTASRIARSPIPGYILTGLLLGAGIVNSILIPQPVWFSIVSYIIYLVAGFAGTRLGARAAVAPSVRPPASNASA